MIKWRLTKSEFVDEFLKIDSDSFSREALEVMFDYYNDVGVDVEFDPIAFRCDWSEYESEQDALEQYGVDSMEDLEDMVVEVFRLSNGRVLVLG